MELQNNDAREGLEALRRLAHEAKEQAVALLTDADLIEGRLLRAEQTDHTYDWESALGHIKELKWNLAKGEIHDSMGIVLGEILVDIYLWRKERRLLESQEKKKNDPPRLTRSDRGGILSSRSIERAVRRGSHGYSRSYLDHP